MKETSNDREYDRTSVGPLPRTNGFYRSPEVGPRVPKSNERKMIYPPSMEFLLA